MLGRRLTAYTHPRENLHQLKPFRHGIDLK
jgi:hypothetical protein